MLGERFKADGKAAISLSERQIKAKERFIEENNNILSPYQYEAYHCECGATEENFEILSEKDRYGLNVRTVICRKCGLVMTNPRLTQAAYDYFYDMEYGKLYRDQDKMDAPYFMKRVMAGKAIYDFINQNNGVMPKEILEIGCAAGGILYYFKEQGCNVTGVDLGSAYIEYGRELGLNLLNCHSSELKNKIKNMI